MMTHDHILVPLNVTNFPWSQAVVVSLDPRRVYVADRGSTEHHCVGPLGSEKGTPKGPNGEAFAWYLGWGWLGILGSSHFTVD